MAKEIAHKNYVTILGWMVTDLHLKGNELLIFAIIHGFSQDGEGEFTGSVAYLQSWTGLSYQGVANVLKSLVEKSLLAKTQMVVNGVTFCHYRTLDPPKNFGTPSQKSWDNIDRDNNISSNEDNNTISKRGKFDFRKALIEMGVEPEIAEAWMAVRKTKRATNTKVAFDAVVKEIAKSGLSANDCIRIAAENSWQGFRAEWLKDRRGSRAAAPKSGDKFERMMAVGQEIFGKPLEPIYDEQ